MARLGRLKKGSKVRSREFTSRIRMSARGVDRADRQPAHRRMRHGKQSQFENLARAIVGVGKPGEGGRGFVVELESGAVVITAAHCLPSLPPAHAFSKVDDRTYETLLGPLGADPTVWTECLFADPVADIAVLGAPDDQALSAEHEAYEELVASVTTPFTIGDAPKGAVNVCQDVGCTVSVSSLALRLKRAASVCVRSGRTRPDDVPRVCCRSMGNGSNAR